MDVKTCGFLSHVPTRFKFGWDEEDPLCIGLKQVLLQQIQFLRRAGCTSFYVVPDSGAGLWIGEILNLLRHDDPSQLLQCLLPHEEIGAKWSPELRDRYRIAGAVYPSCRCVQTRRSKRREKRPEPYDRLLRFRHSRL